MTKRIFDVFVAVIGGFIFLPIMFLIAIIIKTTSKGSIFFLQQRVGYNGQLFKMIKFRSMKMRQISDSTISVKGDPRITKFGSILRKSKLDELPSLWNVFIGDMSLVGPRPDVSGYADKLSGEERNILKLKPGITGPASLKYADEENILAKQKNPKQYNDQVIYPNKVKMNLDYYYNNNLWIDIKIIFATIFKIIS